MASEPALPIKKAFSVYHGGILSVIVPFDEYPLLERNGWRQLTEKVYPVFDINNKYKGYVDKGTFNDMREGWFCTQCEFINDSFLKAISHNIKHLFSIVKKKPDLRGVF